MDVVQYQRSSSASMTGASSQRCESQDGFLAIITEGSSDTYHVAFENSLELMWKKLQEASGDTGDLQYSELEETDRGPHTNSYPFLSAIDLICWTNVMIPDSPGIHKTLSTVHSPHLLSILRRQYPNQLFSFPLYNAYNT
ncbi:uncharacterized protein [Macrobrachium rosenbergii]|uniref:uncharacterized protein isoform X1 n=1 Tax=Macrobrachium rosenbergii TaxID=79674 RepID=UPI0034D4DFB3